MLPKLFLFIYCALFPSSTKCVTQPVQDKSPLPYVLVQSPTPKQEIFRPLTNLNLSAGTNNYKIYAASPQSSDGYQLHLRLNGVGVTSTLKITPLSDLNSLTQKVSGPDVWLASITRDPNTPWLSTTPTKIADLVVTSTTNQSITVELGSDSYIPTHKTLVNLLDNSNQLVTITK
jgi:hypothetical protein